MGRQTDMVKKLTIIARMDHSGLGHQTRNLVRLLNPDQVVAVDLYNYNQFKQHPEWYEDHNTRYISGFIRDRDVKSILATSDIVLTAETFYNNRFVDMAYEAGVTTLCQVNYEFFDPLMNRNLRIPDKILMPSYWHLDDLKQMTSGGRVVYLPPPTFITDFDKAREINENRTGKRRFLHVAGKTAIHDRAGTLDLLNSLQYSTKDFELVVKVQDGEIPQTLDERVEFDFSAPDDETELYKDFDAMIHPRRYAGLNLPMNEALSSGLPVIMTDISPNNRILPTEWLVRSYSKGNFIARAPIELFSADHRQLAEKLDWLAIMDNEEMTKHKTWARKIAVREYSPESIKERWDNLIREL